MLTRAVFMSSLKGVIRGDDGSGQGGRRRTTNSFHAPRRIASVMIAPASQARQSSEIAITIRVGSQSSGVIV